MQSYERICEATSRAQDHLRGTFGWGVAVAGVLASVFGLIACSDGATPPCHWHETPRPVENFHDAARHARFSRSYAGPLVHRSATPTSDAGYRLPMNGRVFQIFREGVWSESESTVRVVSQELLELFRVSRFLVALSTDEANVLVCGRPDGYSSSTCMVERWETHVARPVSVDPDCQVEQLSRMSGRVMIGCGVGVSRVARSPRLLLLDPLTFVQRETLELPLWVPAPGLIVGNDAVWFQGRQGCGVVRADGSTSLVARCGRGTAIPLPTGGFLVRPESDGAMLVVEEAPGSVRIVGAQTPPVDEPLGLWVEDGPVYYDGASRRWELSAEDTERCL